MHPPFSTDVLCRWNLFVHGPWHVWVHAGGTDARSARMETHFLHPGFPPLCQSTGRGADELALGAVIETLPAPATGFFLRHHAGLPDDGGRSHHAHQSG